MTSRTVLSILLLLIPATLTRADEPKSPAASTEAVQVIGFGDIKNNTKGTLELKDGGLHFTSKTSSFNVTADTIEDVVTGADTQRAIRGTVGTLSQLAPYGAGRALSMLRQKIDTLTIEYRDSNGALHGAVFTMPVGNAEAVKEDLLSQGAKSTMPMGHDSTQSGSQSEAQERLR